jgi:hypothetical protein
MLVSSGCVGGRRHGSSDGSQFLINRHAHHDDNDNVDLWPLHLFEWWYMQSGLPVSVYVVVHAR